MNCPKCGEELHNDAKYCDACGCSIEQKDNDILHSTKVFTGMGEQDETFHVQSTTLEMEQKRLKKKKKEKKGGVVSLLIIMAMVLALGIAGVFVYRALYEKPYERAVGKMLALLNDRSTSLDDYLKTLLPDKICKDIDEIIKADSEETGRGYEKEKADINKSLNSVMDKYESQWGDDFKFDYDVIDERKLSSDELADVSEAYANMSQLANQFSLSGDSLSDEGRIKSYEAYNKLIEDFENIEFEEGYELEVEITMSSSSSKQDSEERTKLYVVKTDGKWIIDFMHYLNELGNMNLFDFM